MSEIRNVVVAGASGDLGTAILDTLIQSTSFNVTVLTRRSSVSEFPETVNVVHVDYTSASDLENAIKGQDAVVSALGFGAVEAQMPLIQACVSAGVKRFIPSEFSCNFDNPNTSKLPVYQHLVAVHRTLKAQAQAHPGFSYTSIRNGVLLDWSLARGFIVNFNSETPPFYDGGDRPFSATTLSTVGRAIAGVLQHLEETRNRAVFIHDMITTQREVFGIAKKIAPERKWAPLSVSTADMEAKSQAQYDRGIIDIASSLGFLCRAVFGEGYGGEFQDVDNELLGLGFKTKADLEVLVQAALTRSLPE